MNGGDEMEIAYGYCHCGCGGKTRIAKHGGRGQIKDEPYRFLIGHNLKGVPGHCFTKR